MISAVDLCYADILHHIHIHFEPSRWTHIIGPNGAGKSTLLKALCGILSPTSGNIYIKDRDIRTYSARERARQIAYVPQRLEHLPELSVFSFVMQSRFAIEDDAQAIEKTRSALAYVDLLPFAERRLNTLSGGELQRATLAAAIAQHTPILLLDEPTSSLDMAQTEHLQKLLSALRREGKTIISVTHDLSLAAATADHTLVLVKGDVVWNAPSFPDDSAINTFFGTTTYQRIFPTCSAQPTEDKASVSHSPAALSSQSGITKAASNSITKSISDKYYLYYLLISFILFIIFIIIMPWVGSSLLDPRHLSAIDSHILLQLRIPRVIWGAVSGCTLACVGATLQAMLQNPLATPYTLGMASGASLGAMLAISLGLTTLWILPTASFVGALLVMLLVLAFTARSGNRSPAIYIITGVAAGMFCSAISMIFQALSAPLTAQQMMRWQMGGLDVVGYTSTYLIPWIALSLLWLYRLAIPLDLISVDASLAQTRGVSVALVRKTAFVLTCLATALVISICGPISFVGLLVPLCLRRRFGADLKRLLPICATTGALFILLADMIARIAESVASVPVGVIVSIIGVPGVIVFFLPKKHKI